MSTFKNETPSSVSLNILEGFFKQAPFPLAMTEGPEHRFVFANPAYLQMLFQNRDIIGLTVRELAPEAEAQGYMKLLDDVYRTGTPYRAQATTLTLKRPDGSDQQFYLDFVFHPLRDDREQIKGILAFVIDVTEQVAARTAVESQQRWLESILEKMPSALFLVDPKTGRLNFANQVGRKMVGQPMEESFLKDRFSALKAFDIDGRQLPIEEFPSARLARGEDLNNFEFTLETASGRYNLRAFSEIIPANLGHVETAVLVYEDITAIRQAEEQFRLLAELAPNMHFIADASGAITFFSRRWYDYIGAPGKATEGWGWKELPIHHPDDLKRALDRWTHSVRSGEPYEIEYRLRRHDGEYRWHLGRAVPVHGSSGVIEKWFGTNVDIHEQKLLSERLDSARVQAENASATKSAFLANMSHEIRTPLGAMLGFAELMKNTPLTPEAQHYLDVIERNGKSLARVIDDILDLSKVEAGQMSVVTSPFSLIDILKDVITVFQDTAKAKGIDLSYSTRDLPLRILSDPARVRQILINLIGNAVKFTMRGSVTVSASAAPAASGRTTISIRVTDTGIGMTAEQSERLFQPFMQGDQGTSRRFGGTGLGLALSRRLANAMGGDVRIVNSQPATGSVFAFDLPVQISGGPLTTAPPASSAMSLPKPNITGARILVVDDAADNRALMKVMLKRAGAVTEEADSGESAVRKALEGNFDLVLMDIQMPGMDGYQALAELQRQNYKGPVVALTAHAMLEEREHTRQAGFIDHITKPVDRESLMISLDRLLKN